MELGALQMASVQVQNQSHSSEGALSSLEEALSDRYGVMVQPLHEVPFLRGSF